MLMQTINILPESHNVSNLTFFWNIAKVNLQFHCFSFISANNPGGIFQIDITTGLITVQGTIDREATGSSFYLTVQVIAEYSNS